MKKITLLIQILCICAPFSLFAQQTINGRVSNSLTGEAAYAISIRIKDSKEGTFSDDRGRFQLKTNKPLPLILSISAIGFEPREVLVESAASPLEIPLNVSPILGQEVVVSASRTVQTKLSSPVTIEQISNKDIRNSAQISYMDMLQGLRGVDVTVSSIGFTSVTTRGFNTSGNTNFTQIVDGMDNQAPGLNFPLGSVIGLTQLDVDNIELLSGASSALYGSRGLNGTMIATGKNPFKYQGLSVLVTQGVNHINAKKNNDPVPASPYYDWTIRYAKQLSNKIAFKVNGQYTQAKDWVANDETNKNGLGTALTDPNYNGVNMYGGATSVDINPFLEAALAGNPDLAPIVEPLLAHSNYVSRTGYPEYGYLDNRAKLFKVNGEFRYKISPDIEAIASATFGTGNIVYTNDTRYQLKGFKVGQYRLEVRSDKWFVRAYTTQENSGKTLVAGPTAQYINESWKTSYDGNVGGWYPEYTAGLLNALATGTSLTDAHLQGRTLADQGRAELGSALFNRLKDSISNTPISEGGTLFLDRSKLYNAEAQYNFSDHIKFMQVIAGVNWRLYSLNSKNTLFPDKDKPIHVNEYSAYLQMAKRVMDERLNIATSFRYDKNTLFAQPRLTSRASLVYDMQRQNYLRFSYQNAYSFPSNIQALQNTLNGYNSFSSGGSSLLLIDNYQFDRYPPYTLESVQKFQSTNDPKVLQQFKFDDIKPQSVNAFELGYAAMFGKRVMVDVLGYFSTWKNFIGYANVANTPGTDDINAFKDHATYVQYNVAFNGGETVNTYGYAASVSIDLGKNFMTKANYYSDYLKNKNNSQINNFNTPNYHFNFEFGNSGFGKKQVWSFSTSLRYKPGYYYVVSGGLAAGQVPSSTVIDAQVSYKLIKARSGIRIGGTNITNKYYSTGIANPRIGAVYYVTYAYNIF
ncbi:MULTISPECIES: TonB-dependent receptor plug domain-containing protein [Sphingobacterium]|uniref:Carboxypeptidase-like protein n=1 Tax=Sphingobacterium detergens TaxID=1145106 RepID=A0A420AQI8_SPHD1|nr:MULTISPECIES: TonB-dependent receptor plug domain-containing protein [Sphingobacterium]MCS4225324.1 outer membrane receptor for ferrienterochelin and colicin [Sphingobacterium sp. BIGb0165]RKE46744.1 carboxypeptidase-like protein [Sphingobacterium detergens]